MPYQDGLLLERPNVGLASEACHIRFAGSKLYAEAVRELHSRLYGIDFAEVFQALRETGFDGHTTVIADAPPGADRTALAREYLNMCRNLTR